jgi:hypothetical protein
MRRNVRGDVYYKLPTRVGHCTASVMSRDWNGAGEQEAFGCFLGRLAAVFFLYGSFLFLFSFFFLALYPMSQIFFCVLPFFVCLDAWRIDDGKSSTNGAE